MTNDKVPTMLTVREYAAMEGIAATEEDLARWDRELAAQCRRNGVRVGKRYTLSEEQMDELQAECSRGGYVQALQELSVFLCDLHQGLVSDSVRGTPIEVVDGLITYVMTHLEDLGVVAPLETANDDER